MKRPRLRTWLMYALVGMGTTASAALVVTLLVNPTAHTGIWIAAAVAYLLQLGTFAVLVAARDNPQLFLSAWLSGLVLRFTVLAAGAFLLRDDGSLPRAPMLLSYVTFVFILLLLEPVFMRWDLRRQ